jgi:hypothetical protein
MVKKNLEANMISNKVVLEAKIGERSYQLICSNDAPLGEAHDALCQFKAYVIEKMQEAEKKPEAVEAPKE